MNKTSNQCHSCKKHTNDAVLSCDLCDHWICADCHNLSAEVVKMLEDNASKFVMWFCSTCGPKTSEKFKVSSKLDDIINLVKAIPTSQPIVNVKPTSDPPLYSQVASTKISNIVHKSITNHSNYIADLERRSTCHILHGVPDESDASVFVNDLFKNTLKSDIKPTSITRLGTTNTTFSISKRIIRIVYSSIDEKNAITSTFKLLKSSPHFRSIRFSDDLNSEQQHELKECIKLAATRNSQETDVNIKHVVRGSPSKNLRVVRLTIQA